jgi:murein DD-endopeptidase MepM/ murein hydrolase activator NlpD
MLCQIQTMRLTLAFSFFAIACVATTLSIPAFVLAQAAPGTADFDPSNPAQQTLVMRGETLFNIAERTRSPLQALIHVNRLAPPYAISPGQVLQLPPLKVHVVASDETFTAIARRYSMDERSLAVFNRLPRPVVLKIGQRIILPPTVVDRFTGLEPQDLLDLLGNEIQAGREVTGTIPGQIVRNIEASSPQVTPLPQPPRPPRVAPAGPSSDGAGDVIRSADTGTFPRNSGYGPSQDGDGVTVYPKAPPAAVAPPRQLASLPPPPPRPTQPPRPQALPGITDLPAPSMAGLFIWPVAGRVVETFGTKSDLRTFDGIEIESPQGSPFKAAAAGTVVYVGNQLPGYGWLVLIRHSDGIMSAYAYAQSVNVHEGQIVARGQTVGLVGTTGRAPTPRLHFQIRYNTRPVDPLPRLPHVRGAA